MAWQAVKWVKSWTGQLTSAEKFVLFGIAEHFNEKELRAWPSWGTLCQFTCLGRSTVFRSIDSLVEKRLVEKEEWITTSGRPLQPRYCLPMYDSRSVASPKPVVVLQEWGPDGRWITEYPRARGEDRVGVA